MIKINLPSPAWQDEQMAAYRAAIASENEAGRNEVMARIVEAFGSYLEVMAMAYCPRRGGAKILDYENILFLPKQFT